jgi:hypothetical protein
MQHPKHPYDHCGVELDAFIGQYGQPANVTGKSQVARTTSIAMNGLSGKSVPLSEAGSNRVEQKLTFRCSGCGTANIAARAAHSVVAIIYQ